MADFIIYKLSSPHIDDVYVGSTSSSLEDCNRDLRFAYDRFIYKNRQGRSRSFFVLFDAGINDVKIELLEEISDWDLLPIRTRYYIEKFSAVNKIIPSRTRKEYYEANKEKRNKASNKWSSERINYM